MVDEIRGRLDTADDGIDALRPVTRARLEGALAALEALLGQAPSLLGDRQDEFRL
jgi:glutathione S-transferase